MIRLLSRIAPVRWWRTLWGITRGVRIHPDALILGHMRQIQFGKNVKLGKGVVLDPGKNGRICLGDHVWLARDVEMETNTRISIGSHTTVQRRSTINGNVNLGTECIIAPSVFISSGIHPIRVYAGMTIRSQERMMAAERANSKSQSIDYPVNIGNDCWLGVHSVICPGVIIENHCVVGANAVVTKNVTRFSVVAGVPAKIIGKRE